jgi:hypothetical protein
MPRNSKEFRNGVLDFIEFVLENTKALGRITCPCKKYYFRKTLIPHDVYNHLVWGKGGGFLQGYTTWFFHGVQLPSITGQATNAPVISKPIHEGCNMALVNREPIHEGSSGMQAMLHDVFPMHNIQVDEGGS